jgi:hypothetical protein
MNACCAYTYEKYLSAEGKVDEKALAVVLKKHNQPVPPAEATQKVCKCMCHMEGVVCRH